MAAPSLRSPSEQRGADRNAGARALAQFLHHPPRRCQIGLRRRLPARTARPTMHTQTAWAAIGCGCARGANPTQVYPSFILLQDRRQVRRCPSPGTRSGFATLDGLGTTQGIRGERSPSHHRVKRDPKCLIRRMTIAFSRERQRAKTAGDRPLERGIGPLPAKPSLPHLPP